MVLIAPHEHEREPEQEIPSDVTNEQITYNAPDLDCAEREPQVRNQGKCEIQGTVPERPSAVVPEPAHDRDQVSEDVRHNIGFGKSSGERLYPGAISSVNIYQFRREALRIQHLVLPSLSLMPQGSLRTLQRNPQVGLVLSRLFWGSPPLSMPRFAWNILFEVLQLIHL